MRLVDLSHLVEHGTVTYPGLPGPVICDFLSREGSRARYAPGVEFQIGKIEMVANTGTYVDAPFHRYADGSDIARLPLESLAGLDGIVVRAAPSERAIGAEAFAARDLRGKAVLVHTGWDVHWGTPAYLSNNPYLTAAAADALVRGGALLVGIDSLNIDDLDDAARPVHSSLLGAGIPIVEHLCALDQVPAGPFRFFAVPPAIRSGTSFPVRAFALCK